MESLDGEETIAGFDHEDSASMERVRQHLSNEMGEDFGDEMAQTIDSQDEAESDTDGSG